MYVIGIILLENTYMPKQFFDENKFVLILISLLNQCSNYLRHDTEMHTLILVVRSSR